MIATIACQVSWNDDAPVGGFLVEAHQVIYGGVGSIETRLARARTDLGGYITLVFPAVFDGFVRVRVIGSDGNPLGGEVLTAPITGLHPLSVVLSRPGSVRSEVERLMRAIRPWTDGSLRRLMSWEPRRLEHLTQQTTKSLDQLRLLQQAAIRAESLEVPVELLYGLGRAGLPMSVRGLSGTSRQERRRALARAVAKRWIPMLSETERKRHLDRLSEGLGRGARLRAWLSGLWGRWRRREPITTVDITTTTAMTLA